jgi:hypothetical protein
VRPQAPSPGVNCGHPHAYLVDVDGNLEELEGPTHSSLGTGEEQPTFTASDRQLASDERLILVTAKGRAALVRERPLARLSICRLPRLCSHPGSSRSCRRIRVLTPQPDDAEKLRD